MENILVSPSYQKQLQDARNALEINLPFQRQTVIEWGL